LHHIDNYELNALTMWNKSILLLTACISATALSAQNTTKTDSTKTQKLEEVVVAQRRQLIKNDIDKLTYDVQHDKTAQTKTTLVTDKKTSGFKALQVLRCIGTDILTQVFRGRTLRIFSRQYLLLRLKGLRLSLTPVPSMMLKGLRQSSTSS